MKPQKQIEGSLTKAGRGGGRPASGRSQTLPRVRPVAHKQFMRLQKRLKLDTLAAAVEWAADRALADIEGETIMPGKPGHIIVANGRGGVTYQPGEE